MTDQTHRPILWSTLEEYEGDAEALARRGGGDWNSKPKGFAEILENLPISEIRMRRRAFLKMSGFAAVLAAAAGCEKPAEKILPYVNQPEEVVPGIANYYASTCGGCAAGCGLLVKTREGRPIKLEGNPNSPVNEGSLCSRGQASLLDLYDPDRLRKPLVTANNTTAQWDKVDAETARALAEAGARAVLLTGTLHGPARRAVLDEFKRAFPKMRHVVTETLAEEERAAARELLFGSRAIPRYRFDKSEVTVLLGADPISDGPSPVEQQRLIGQSRRIRKNADGTKTMGRLIAFEPLASTTGMNADLRFAAKTSQLPLLALAIAHRLASDGHSEIRGVNLPAPPSNLESEMGLPAGTIKRVADDLWAHRGKSLVYTGGLASHSDQALELHLAVELINAMLGNEGKTVEPVRPSHQQAGSNSAMAALLEDMQAGKVDVLLLHGVNPAYSMAANGVNIGQAFSNVSYKVSFNTHLDESSQLCDYVLPDVHYLENWGDAEPYQGWLHLRQPVIGKLWNNRAFEESLISIARAGGSGAFDVSVPAETEDGEPGVRVMSWHEFLKKTWREQVFEKGDFAASKFDDFWFSVLRRGFVELPSKATAPAAANTSEAVERLRNLKAAKQGGFELTAYTMTNTYDGRHQNNPWLLELPDPTSKICWDNFVAVAPSTARENKLKDGRVVRLKANGAMVEGPVRIHPGMHPGVLAVAGGWGRTAAGAVGNGEGFNVFALGKAGNGRVVYSGFPVEMEVTGDKIELADVQGHNYLQAKPGTEVYDRPLVLGTSLDLYNESEKNPQAKHHIPYWKLGEPKPDAWRADWEYAQHKWVMTIDLNSCLGCNACMVACQAENNIPVVGKREVLVGREMHWIRIDRYYRGEPDNPEFLKSPMLCQHCDNAPCETVCPVLATVHSDEGINQQAYNRCVGTRYCANNCPYKVRRFNFYQYSSFRKGPHDELEEGAEKRIEKSPLALALNPEITVRTKGIMEKCTFCQQRIRQAKYDARREGSNIPDGALQTACQQTCPSKAITFGDAVNPEHEVNRVREENAYKRGFGVLEEFNVKPNVMYLAQIWNRETREHDRSYLKEAAYGKGHGDEGHGHDQDDHGHGSDEDHSHRPAHSATGVEES